VAIPTLPFAPRVRAGLPARHRPDPLPSFGAQTIQRMEAALAEPYVGVTTDGRIVPGLFSLEQTGVSTDPLREAARAFLDSLDADTRATASFALEDTAWQKWNNTHPFILRHGVLVEALGAKQRELALELMRVGLSARGFETARDVMRLNETIAEITERWNEYGEWVYWVSIFDTPSRDEPWGWQIDGHHLNLNCLVLRDQIVMTPMFMGSEPTHAPMGKYAGTRVFEAEETRALELMRALSDAQKSSAVLFWSNRFSDMPEQQRRTNDGHIESRAQRDNFELPYAGLRADRLSHAQQQQLLDLIEVYVGRLRAGHDRVRMAEIAAHLDETHLAWMGGTDDDSTFYYRIHSPVVLIEFDHLRGVALDNDEPARTHIHTVVRTPNGNDYGKDLLRQHYARVPHGH
jgi:Protein of unknown function (DUF3500)